MAISPIEDTPRFLRELADACEARKLSEYAEKWVDSAGDFAYDGAWKLRAAADAVETLGRLSNYVVEHFT